jgi:hypothetical protein
VGRWAKAGWPVGPCREEKRLGENWAAKWVSAQEAGGKMKYVSYFIFKLILFEFKQFLNGFKK